MSIIRSILLTIMIMLAGSAPAWAGPVDINTADAEMLAAAIDGVGERKARAIVEYRRQHGPFRSVDELVEVKGIGLSTVENNRAGLTAGSPGR
jgi:competence protein ComEA